MKQRLIIAINKDMLQTQNSTLWDKQRIQNTFFILYFSNKPNRMTILMDSLVETIKNHAIL